MENADIAPLCLSGQAMILEDNLLIAMDASDMLSELGATQVHIVSNVAEALEVLQTQDISFALLDVNLGHETSVSVAEDCIRRGVPVVLATGYANHDTITAQFPKMKIIDKPFSMKTMQAAIAPA